MPVGFHPWVCPRFPHSPHAVRWAGGIQQRIPGFVPQRICLGVHHCSAAAFRIERFSGEHHHWRNRQKRIYLPGNSIPGRISHSHYFGSDEGQGVVSQGVRSQNQPADLIALLLQPLPALMDSSGCSSPKRL